METIERDLRTGRPLWADNIGRRVPVAPLTAPIEVDVAIVGAGISGAFTAHDLAPDFSVAVVDRRGPVLGSTMASTAMLQWELDLPLIALAEKIGAADASRVYRRSRAAVDCLVGIVRRERIRCGLESKNSLYLAGDAYGSRALRQEADARRGIGLSEFVYLDPSALRERFGVRRTGAILSEGSASADPACLAAGLLRRAAARGARIFAPVEVTGVLQGAAHVSLITDAGVELRARHVVFCCGYEFPKGGADRRRPDHLDVGAGEQTADQRARMAARPSRLGGLGSVSLLPHHCGRAGDRGRRGRGVVDQARRLQIPRAQSERRSSENFAR